LDDLHLQLAACIDDPSIHSPIPAIDLTYRPIINLQSIEKSNTRNRHGSTQQNIIHAQTHQKIQVRKGFSRFYNNLQNLYSAIHIALYIKKECTLFYGV